MQSSFTVFCRALVMLTCLVVLPLAAITGGTGRKVIVPLVERCLDMLRERPTEPTGSLPRSSPPSGATARQPPGARPSTAAEPVPGAAHSGDQATGSARGSYLDRGVADHRQDRSASDAAGRSIAAAAIGVSPPLSGSQLELGRRQAIVQRLKGLGATYYTLEKWGGSDRLFRFECRMAIARDANYTRFFEATSERPLGAMDEVLRQVEAWRADRHVR